MTQTQPLVLVVEDDDGVRQLMEAILEAEGFEVRTAGDGLEGLLKAKMLQPAALVLDMMMPEVGGLRVLDQLGDELSDTPVLVATGDPRAAEEARRRLGAANVFDKPFDLDAFVLRLRQVAGTPDVPSRPGPQAPPRADDDR